MKKKHKTYIFYAICVFLVIYFMQEIAFTTNEITQKELFENVNIKQNDFNLDIFDVNNIQNQDLEFQTYGQYIWKIAIYLINIIFTCVIMLKIYIDEEENE
jgi:hypothetical protein